MDTFAGKFSFAGQPAKPTAQVSIGLLWPGFRLLCARLLYAAFFLSTYVTDAIAQQAVPRTQGMAVTEADRILRRQFGFETKFVRIQSNMIASGHVIETRPAEGAQVARGSPVVIVVSVGPGPGQGSPVSPPAVAVPAEQVQVPFVAGREEADARRLIEEAMNGQSSVEYEVSDSFAAGAVTRTDPIEGSYWDRGQIKVVLVYVSKGKATSTTPPPEELTVPETRGLTAKVATIKLRDEIQVNVARENEQSDSVAAGHVTRTDPPAGTTMPKAELKTVIVWVSSGPLKAAVQGTLQIPDLSNSNLKAALVELKAKGFTSVRYRPKYSESIPREQVIETDPPAGRQVRSTAVVSVVYSLGPTPLWERVKNMVASAPAWSVWLAALLGLAAVGLMARLITKGSRLDPQGRSTPEAAALGPDVRGRLVHGSSEIHGLGRVAWQISIDARRGRAEVPQLRFLNQESTI